MTFLNEGDSLIFVADLLNAYGESLEDVFERVFRMCIGGVNLQHFNKNHLVDSDYSSIDFGIYLHAIFHSVFTFTVQSPQNLRSNLYNRKSENGS